MSLVTTTLLCYSPVTCRCYSRVRTYDTVDDVANFIKDSPQCNIAVMVGAGISTLSGIPDFRCLHDYQIVTLYNMT